MKEIFTQIYENKYLIIPLLTWFCIQLYKVIYDTITQKKFNWKRFLQSGGMPSSHSAVVMVLTVLIGKYEGFNSPIFALALLFSIIVMYDALTVRRAAGEHAKLLNKIVKTKNMNEVESNGVLAENLGHTPKQVIIGAIIGIIIGIIA